MSNVRRLFSQANIDVGSPLAGPRFFLHAPLYLGKSQANINSANLARLNRYCHRVCPVSHHVYKRAANSSPVFATPAKKFELEGAGQDLLGLSDFGGSMSGPGLEENAAKSTSDSPVAAEAPPQFSHYVSPVYTTFLCSLIPIQNSKQNITEASCYRLAKYLIVVKYT